MQRDSAGSGDDCGGNSPDFKSAVAAALLPRPECWPLRSALARERAHSPLALHLPAHRRGQAPAFRRPRLPWAWDLPELPTIGGPLLVDGAVAESQALIAQAQGVDFSWYGVNGASGLLQAAVLALAGPSARVLLPRHHHRSLLHAAVLAGFNPLLYTVPFDAAAGLWQPLLPQQLEQLLQQAGPVDLLVLLSPTYQGLASDLPSLVAIAHRHGVPVLVDEAHGAHFGFDPTLPKAATAAGADLVVQSLHKSLGALAQTAVLHAQGPRVERDHLCQALEWVQSSSPSALLMLSAEQSIAQRYTSGGQRQLRRCLHQARALRDVLQAHGLPLLTSDDPLRLVLHTAPLGCSGAQADAWLMARDVVAECPEVFSLTFCLGLGNSQRLQRPLLQTLQTLRRAFGEVPLQPLQPPPLPALCEPELSPGAAWRSPSRQVPLAQAHGCLAARPVCPYPPGIPLLLPGERLDAERLAWLAQQRLLWGEQIADTVTVLA
jgi:lysine decarboxylase